MKLNEHQMFVLEGRYLKRNDDGEIIETPDEMFWRVAKHVALAEKSEHRQEYAEKFYLMMSNGYFLPNTPTLINAGNELGQLSACFVVPIEDSIEDIFDHVKSVALIHKSGGGTGTNYSTLRPAGSLVSTTKGQASGPVSFMKVVNEAIEQVKQGGVRRGAKMGILDYNHPDVFEFINSKVIEGQLQNFNISIGLWEEFFECLHNKRLFEQRFGDKKFKLIDPNKLLDEIAKCAWMKGEPGVIFFDIINKYNTVPGLGTIKAVNPCGEQPLFDWESCNLGSINIFAFVEYGQIKFEKLHEIIRLAVRFLDDVIDVNKYPLPQIEQQTKLTRKIGLGIMGWADALYKLGIPYDSNKAVEAAESLMKHINDIAVSESSHLATERGSFPVIDKSIYKHPMRNATVTTIAPTGSISIIAGTSSGIEPNFALCYKKKVAAKDDRTKFTDIEMFNPLVEQLIDVYKLSQSEIDLIKETGSLQKTSLPKPIKEIYKTALEISPKWHLEHQAAFQRFTHNAVSKTINLPSNTTPKDIKEIILLAHKLGCKGLTIYRVGSRRDEALTIGSKQQTKPKSRPRKLTGSTIEERTGCGKLFITTNTNNGKLFEVFVEPVGGGCPGFSKGFAILLSTALRAGVDITELTRRLSRIYCPSCFVKHTKKETIGISCPDIICKILFEELNENKNNEYISNDNCPICDSPMIKESGCQVCQSCGFSYCK